MPPKNKSVNDIEAELKKKTAAQAKEIVAKLKGETIKEVKTSYRKKTEKAIEPKKKIVAQNKGKAEEFLGSTGISSRESTDNALVTGTLSETASDFSVPDFTGETSTSSQVTRRVETETSDPKKSKTVVPKPKRIRPNGTAYQYEIDCTRVSDSIDVIDLQRYFEKHLKVNGKKDNLSGIVSIRCSAHKVIIESNVFLPKKALRFLSKKFLKKNWNIQVLSKNRHSYEYKYVGTI